jgi:hypothetical protein
MRLWFNPHSGFFSYLYLKISFPIYFCYGKHIQVSFYSYFICILSPLEKFARSCLFDGLVLVSLNVSQAKVSFLIRVCQANMRYHVIISSYSNFNKYFYMLKYI